MRLQAHQKGVALVIVLLLVALVSVLAVEMGARLQLQIKRAANLKDNNQAYWYAMGAEQFAEKSIKQLLDSNSNGDVTLEQPWHEEVAYPLTGGGIQAQLKDMSTCFNLNSLQTQSTLGTVTSDTPEGDAFLRLMQNLQQGEGEPLDIDNYTMETVRDSLMDWLDTDSVMNQNGAEDAEYESRSHPYLAANNLMASKSELRLINGVDPKWLPNLMELVCVVPQTAELRINVNTLQSDQAPLLAALIDASLADANTVISNRPQNGYGSIQDFLSDTTIAGLGLSNEQQQWFITTTEHFILHTKTKYNNATFAMSSVLKVDGNQDISVIRREFGGVL